MLIARIATNEHVGLVLTTRGGHVGFGEGWWPVGDGYIERAVVQFVNALIAIGGADEPSRL